jgi:hypothetical protein
VLEAVRTVFGELGEPPHVPCLPELPDRGPGAEMVGRGAALLVDLPVDLQPSGWRLVDRPGRDVVRSRAWLRQDLEVLAEVAEAYRGPVKLQAAGPWTLAAGLRLPRLERAVVDPGACRDLVSSLAEGLAQHVQEVRRLVPDAEVVVQLDEPSLPAVLAGELRTASGFGRLRAVEEQAAVDGLRAVLEAASDAGAIGTLVHCCAPDVPVPLLVRAGAGGIGADASLLGERGWEALAEAVEAGVGLWAGAVPVTGPDGPGGSPPRPDDAVEAVLGPWRRLGLDAGRLAQVVLTPACGLAGLPLTQARSALTATRRAAGLLGERAEE